MPIISYFKWFFPGSETAGRL